MSESLVTNLSKSALLIILDSTGPACIITDKQRRYSAAKAEVMPSIEHLQPQYQNNRAENSHQPTRLRACDEAVQVSGPRAVFSLGLRNHYVTLPSLGDICTELAVTEQ